MPLYRLLAMRFFQSANVLGVILTLYYRAHGLDYTQILSFEIVLSGAMAAGTVPFGLWADRHGRVRALKYGNAVFALAALVFLVSRVYWQFLLSDLLYGVGLAWQSGADTALLAAGGTRWFARYQAVAAAAGMVGSLAAGGILQVSGSRWLVILNAAAALLALLSVVTITDDRPSPEPRRSPPWHLARQAWGAVVAAPWLWAWTVAGVATFRLVGINLMFLDLPLWVHRGWHGIWLGVGVTTLYAAGWASLGAPGLRARLGSRATLSLSQVAAGALVGLLPFLRSPWLLTVAMAGALGVQSWQTPIADSAVVRSLPEPVRVTALSILDVPSIAVTIVCEIGVGMLADVHLPWALWASGAAILVAAPLWWVRARPGAPEGLG